MIQVVSYTDGWKKWDAFVHATNTASHCHLSGWRRIITTLYRHECIYLGAHDDNGTLVGILPLVRLKSPWFGHFLVSMPFLNAGGPIGTSAAIQALVNKAVEITATDSSTLLELRSREPLEISLLPSHRKITSILDLHPGAPAHTWESLPSKVRSQIRRPQREGMEVQFGSEHSKPFFEIFSKNMRDLGTPTQPYELFEMITEEFPDDVWFGCVYHNNQAVAGGCAIQWKDELEMLWASSLAAFNPLAPNMLLYWAFIERAAQNGMSAFNFGRCTPGSNTHRFKRQWGAHDVPLWWYVSASGTTVSLPSPNDPAYAWKRRVWQRLPVPVATTLGPYVVRYIP